MYKQSYFPKILNLFMFSALLYLSLKVVHCINSEQEELEKVIKNKIPTNEITLNNIFNYKSNKQIEISEDSFPYNIDSLLINGSFSILLTCFLNWRKLLSAGTI